MSWPKPDPKYRTICTVMRDCVTVFEITNAARRIYCTGFTVLLFWRISLHFFDACDVAAMTRSAHSCNQCSVASRHHLLSLTQTVTTQLSKKSKTSHCGEREWCGFSPSEEKSLEFAINRTLMKLFWTISLDVMNECYKRVQLFLGITDTMLLIANEI